MTEIWIEKIMPGRIIIVERGEKKVSAGNDNFRLYTEE